VSLLVERSNLCLMATAVKVSLFTGTDFPGRRVQGDTGTYLLMRAALWAA